MTKLIKNIEATSNAKPFLRWAGGKSWLIKELQSYIPTSFNNYHEPFLGGGSVFIYLKSKGIIKSKAYLSDKNEDLINAYNAIKNDPSFLIELLNNYENSKEFYYHLRDQKFNNEIEKAAQFIFLNRTSFNGIYRVSLNGKFNVPYGFKKYKQLFDFDNIVKINNLLQNVELKSGDFENSIEIIQQNDLIFLDPPYTVAHGKNGFIKYNQKIFAWKDQERLERFIDKIKEKQAYFILTNAAHESIENLFENIGVRNEVKRYSVIGGKSASRKKISEYIFTNCKI